MRRLRKCIRPLAQKVRKDCSNKMKNHTQAKWKWQFCWCPNQGKLTVEGFLLGYSKCLETGASPGATLVLKRGYNPVASDKPSISPNKRSLPKKERKQRNVETLGLKHGFLLMPIKLWFSWCQSNSGSRDGTNVQFDSWFRSAIEERGLEWPSMFSWFWL